MSCKAGDQGPAWHPSAQHTPFPAAQDRAPAPGFDLANRRGHGIEPRARVRNASHACTRIAGGRRLGMRRLLGNRSSLPPRLLKAVWPTCLPVQGLSFCVLPSHKCVTRKCVKYSSLRHCSHLAAEGPGGAGAACEATGAGSCRPQWRRSRGRCRRPLHPAPGGGSGVAAGHAAAAGRGWLSGGRRWAGAHHPWRQRQPACC